MFYSTDSQIDHMFDIFRRSAVTGRLYDNTTITERCYLLRGLRVIEKFRWNIYIVSASTPSWQNVALFLR